MKELYVLKQNGERELFTEHKIKESLARVGLTPDKQDLVVESIKSKIYHNIPTSEIHNLIQEQLKKVEPTGEIRFRLKKAMMELGPTGYPFEVFVGGLLKEYDYETEVGIELPGECVTHEVDVLAKKKDRVYFVECKYHNQQGMRSDVKVVLYVHARGEDLMVRSGNGKTYGTWIFTNTKFSSDAISYAECKKMRLTGWSYPSKKDCLQTMIENKNLYPITVLQSLSLEQKKLLLQQNLVLVRQLIKRQDLQQQLGLNSQQKERLHQECQLIGCD